jgi:hypothetical protein
MKKIVLTLILAASFLAADDNSSLTVGDIGNYFGSFFGSSNDANKSQNIQPIKLPSDTNLSQPTLGDIGLVAPSMSPNTVLNAVAPKPRASVQKTIISISNDGKSAMIDASGLQRGVSGLVWQQLDETHRMLVARAYISGIKDNKAKIRFTVLEDTAQNALPSLLNRPKAGDNVVFYLLEDRGFIIAPTQTDYQSAVWALPPELKLVHPDLFAAYLTPIRNAKPGENQFRAFCSNIQATNVYFVLSDGIYKTDCFTLAVLETYPFTQSNQTPQKPFYNRIGNIPTGYFGFFKEDMKDYEGYYRSLLGLAK